MSEWIMAPPADLALDLGIDEERDSAIEADDRVRCGSCNAEITLRSLAVRRAGSHQHTFRNPAGYSWTVVCFRHAGGCAAAGDLTTEASWFPGYAWCYANCSSCGRHIGWWFVGARPSFAGLIVTRLAQ